jgi:hippurate hydrolase
MQTTAKLVPEIIELQPEFAALRRELHQHPELGFEEQRTSEQVARLLTLWGYDVCRGLGGTGVVGTLRQGTSPRSIGIRADMDALPIHEASGLPHASTVEGKMHACGHDGHTATLLCASRPKNCSAAHAPCWRTACWSVFRATACSRCTPLRACHWAIC